jgi:hypothetical protein
VGTRSTLWCGKQPVKQSGKEEGRKEAHREPKAARTIYHPTPATSRSSCNRIALDISFFSARFLPFFPALLHQLFCFPHGVYQVPALCSPAAGVSVAGTGWVVIHKTNRNYPEPSQLSTHLMLQQFTPIISR